MSKDDTIKPGDRFLVEVADAATAALTRYREATS